MVPGFVARIRVHLQPRASRNEVLGFQGNTLRIRVTAPPTEGRANKALLQLLATALGVGRSDVELVAGLASREKLVAVAGLAEEEIQHRLQARQTAQQQVGQNL